MVVKHPHKPLSLLKGFLDTLYKFRVVLLLLPTMRAEHSFRHPLVHRCNTPIAITRHTSKVPDVLFMDLITCHSSSVGFMSLKVVPHSSQTTRPGSLYPYES